MMSSEEDADSFGLYGDKLLKKAKRARQRVDAGEPRNSYSSIPNFSSRPSLMSGGLYGAIYSQNQQQHNFGLFNTSGYGTSTSKMLNELLARQVKQAQDAGGPETNMMLSPMEGASNSDGSKHGFENSSPIIRRTSSGGIDMDDATVQPNDLEKLHMLRNILQGKKELMALHDHELRAAAAASAASMNNSIERASPDNNNSISKNNNTNSNNNIVKQEVNIKSETLGNGGSDANDTSEMNVNNRVNQINDDVSRHVDNGEDITESRQETSISGDLNKTLNDNIIDDEMICLNSRSDSENSMPSSPGSDLIGSKDDMDIEMHLDKNNSSPIPQSLKTEPVALDMKRARVENIVNTMRSSPILPSQQHSQVNGCKKRKLYQPQQHDAERYAGLNFNLNLQGLMFGDGEDDDDDEQPPVQQKRVEKSALESELRSLQEKLAEMQQKYVQLCTIVNEHSDAPESQEIDDGNSDTFEPVENKKETTEKQQTRCSVSSSPTISPMKDLSLNSKVSNASNMMLTQVMGKMISSKLHNPAQLAPNFNGTHPLLQHINMTHNSHEHALQQMQHNQQQQQNALNTAAMYFGMNPKFFLEQEVRNNKETSEQKQQSQQRESVSQQLERERQQQNSNQTTGHSSLQLKQAQMQQQERERPMQNSNQGQTHSPQQKECSQSQRTQDQSTNSHGQQSQGALQSQQQQNSFSLNSKMAHTSELSERLNIGRSNTNSVGPVSGTDLEGLADVLKSEITASLSNLVDSIVTRFVHQRRFLNKQSEAAAAAAEQLNKDLMMATQLLDRKSPRTKVAERSSNVQTAAMFQTPKPPQVINPVAAAALYNSMNVLGGQVNQFCMPESRDTNPEQNEALSLVVQPKKKRHKVTDTRITPRTVSRILAQDGIGPTGNQQQIDTNTNMNNNNNNNSTNGKGSVASVMNTSTTTPSESPSPRSSYHGGPPASSMLQALSTSVAIPNPSLHESQVFSPYSPFFNHHNGPHAPQQAQLHHIKMPASPPGFAGIMDPRDSPPLPHPPTMLHPALLVPPPQDYAHIRATMDSNDRNSDSADNYDGLQPTISFSNDRKRDKNDKPKKIKQFIRKQQMLSLTSVNSSTLTPMHLRKAKLMFFWVRYPSSAVLKMYFPDIKFNKNNTAQLVKWFSNFREFYYIQMEKYARQAVSEGIKSPEDLHISGDSEIYRVLNLHYNRNNHIEVPHRFREVVEQTLREFFRSIQSGKDTEQSWKKSIYKVISRMDDSVPEYFKSPNFLEQLE
ncbi:homeobox protein prospero isoform X2 [Contarinia nasturtii]|uniref:homeobox protein prospero isoform X2 n=1 Tax=Contarinia nasturtii TaxID=265458 RepID=UPI0012D3A86C|nr:homeobox protein prospero isoform X2 [Contarinia nasturtii]